MEHLPSAGLISSEKQIDELGLTELTLNNGLKILLKHTNFKNDEILFTGFSKGGSSIYDTEDSQLAENATNFIKAMGLGKHNPTALNNLLNGKSAQVNVAFTSNFETISGITSQEDLETALQMTYLYFTNPRKDKILFDNLIAQSRPSIESRYNNPNTVFCDTVNRILSNYHLRFSIPNIQFLEKLDLYRIMEIYKERFANAVGFTFIFLGNFEEQKLRSMIERYLGFLPSQSNLENFVDHGIRTPKAKINKKRNKQFK